MFQVGDYTLRDDQEKVLAGVRWAVSELRQSGKPARVLVQAACGFGKTIVSCGIMQGAIDKGRRAGFIVRGRQLVEQKSARLQRCRIPHSILMDGYDYHNSAVTVCSVDSYRSRVHERQTVPLVAPDVWVIDEAHLAQSELFLSFVKEADVVVGLTATPIARDGGGMGGFWQRLVKGPTHKELLSQGLLVPCRVFAEAMPDFSQLTIQDGDWSREKVALIMNTRELVGDVLWDYKRWGEGRQFIGWGANVAHAIALKDEFNTAGIPTAFVDADTPPDERSGIFGDLEAGRTRGIFNCDVLSTGADFPYISCGILAFATASLTRLLQRTGRCFRPFPGKTDCVLIDHGGNVHRHGWPQEDRDWTLDPDKKIQELDAERREREEIAREPICCPKCGAMRETGPKCLNCGHEHKRTGMKIKFRDGRIEAYKPKKRPKQATDEQKAWMQILAVCAYRNLPCSAASAMFKRKTGHWPEQAGVGPLIPWEKHGVLVKLLYPNFIRRKAAT